MTVVRLSEHFRSDLRTVIARLAGVAGNRVADDYAAEFRRSIGQLATHPGIGAPRSKYGARIRILIVQPYLIFYEGGPKAEVVTVLRLVDGRRRITKRMIAAGRDDDPGET